jgi:predicted metalloprotease
MRWKDERRSDNVDDERRIQPAGLAISGGVGTLVLALIILFLGGDPREVLRILGQNQPAGVARNAQPAAPNPAEDEKVDFVKVVLGETEDVWIDVFKKMGLEYQKPRLTIFRDSHPSGCGFASAAMGPFYCPPDQKVYIDLSFYDELANRFKAPGEFAEAYVIAHEVGHHVQNLLGISEDVRSRQRGASQAEANALSVRLELQADFLAGVWAHYTKKNKHVIEDGDIESALRAAAAIGDDRLQKQSQGYIVPDSFTHGTSEQRVHWFRRGLQTGDLGQGDTFHATKL